MIAVIVAGGKGTRMGRLGAIIPKALFRVAGKPLIEYQLENLKRGGIKDVFVILNHLGDQIKRFCGDGKRFGLKISYHEETKPLGTAGAIKLLHNKLREDFIVIYGDLLINLDFKRLISEFSRSKRKIRNFTGTLVVHPNDHPFDSDLVDMNEDGRVLDFLSKPHPHGLYFRNLVNAAVYVFTPRILKYIEKNKAQDFGKIILPKVLKRGGVLYGYNTPEYVKDMGTPKRLREVEEAVRSGRFKKSSLAYKKPAIFIDRDGVVNHEMGDLRRVRDFRLIRGTAKAIRLINEQNCYAVIISNQPVIAKGFCTYDEVLRVHKKMETLLARETGAKLDGIYFCPHHPDKGFPGENKKYKIACSCRKPKTGMVEKAVRALNIDLKHSVMIGDSTSDGKLAENLGIQFIGVKTGAGVSDARFELRQKPKVYKDLQTAVTHILDR